MLLQSKQWQEDQIADAGNDLVEAENRLDRPRLTMADVAAKVGVSRVTVSMALRNHHGISLERRRQIQKTAREMGFVPDPFLAALATHRRQRVLSKDHGVLAWLNHWKEPQSLRRFKEFDLYWRGASQAASKLGYRLDEICWTEGCSPKRLEQILLTRGIEGILIPPHREMLDWKDFDWSKFSVVRFGLSVPSPDSNLVTADVFRAIVKAVGKIHEYGYQRIGLTINEQFNQRLGGSVLSAFFYAQNLLDIKSALPPLMTFLENRTAEELSRQKAALKKWLEDNQPDAVLTSDIEVPRMVKELGYRIPDDIALAGTSVMDIPGIDAGIDQHSEAIGRIAAETLLKQMNVNERGQPRNPCRILVESGWKDGQSLPPIAKRTDIRTHNPAALSTMPVLPTTGVVVRRVTLKDIAETAGVSKNTVSIALRNNSRIRLELREKIQCLAKQMGYVADPILQRLGAYRMANGGCQFKNVITWINHWENPGQLRSYREFREYWLGAKAAAEHLGYQLEEFIWPGNSSGKEAEQMLLERGVLGLLIPPHKLEADWDNFDWNRFSLLRFGMTVQEVDAHLVTADLQRAMVMAIKRIFEYGYKRIGLVFDAAHDRSMGGNLYGSFLWTCKLLRLNCPVPPFDFDLQVPAETNQRNLQDWMNQYGPDAVLTTIPQTPGFLRELGYRIPDDVAVAGTSVHDIGVEAGINQHPRAIGKIAAEMLIKQISLNERGEPPNPCRILVESGWRDGRSLPCRA